jgi:hypothetical protein
MIGVFSRTGCSSHYVLAGSQSQVGILQFAQTASSSRPNNRNEFTLPFNEIISERVGLVKAWKLRLGESLCPVTALIHFISQHDVTPVISQSSVLLSLSLLLPKGVSVYKSDLFIVFVVHSICS